MKCIKKVILCCFYIFIVGLVSLCLYTFLMVDVCGKKYANIFGYTYFVVSSGSMSGSIEVDDVVIIKINSNYKKNDIITYIDKDGNFITHRFIKEINGKLISKGDVNNTVDEPIDKKQVIGKVVFIISPRLVFKLLAIILILAIIFILFNFDKIFQKYDKEEKNKPKTKMKNISNSVESKKIKNIPSSGETIKIPIGEIHKLENNDEIELLITDEVSIEIEKKNAKEKKFLQQTVKLLKLKHDGIIQSRITKEWAEKYRFVYKLAYIIKIGDKYELNSLISKTKFEVESYDPEKVGLYDNLLDKLYDMPIYVFLQILVFSVLYNDLEFFDGIYKLLKYKIRLDKNDEFTNINKNSQLVNNKINDLLLFMKIISNKFDDKNKLKLEKLEEFLKVKKYINE